MSSIFIPAIILFSNNSH